jgi:hypothetical protein
MHSPLSQAKEHHGPNDDEPAQKGQVWEIGGRREPITNNIEQVLGGGVDTMDVIDMATSPDDANRPTTTGKRPEGDHSNRQRTDGHTA